MGQARVSVPDTISVWLVEDLADYRETVRDLIDAENDLVCSQVFGSAEDLFAHLNDHFAPEVVLMDIGLPGMSGIEAVARLGRIAPATQVVMLTMHDDDDRIFEAICAGASGYLSKGATAVDVVQAVRSVTRGGAAMSPRIARRVLHLFTQANAPQWDYELTDREKDVLRELVTGLTKKDIAKKLYLSVHTVDTHVRSIYTKLHVNSRSGAVAKALNERLVR